MISPEPVLTPGPVRPAVTRRAAVVCSAWLLAGLVGSYVVAVLTPSLVAHHAVLLEALTGSTAGIVTAGALARVGHAPLLLVLVAPWPTVLVFDVPVWWAGRLWGDRLVTALVRRPRTVRALARTEDLVRRRSLLALGVAYFLPVPNAVVYGLCGASGVPLGRFLLGDLLGLLLWEALLLGLGWALGRHAVDLVHQVDHAALPLTVAVVVVAVVLGRRRRA